MILFVNGAFGIGKTAVARALVRRLRGVLFDPEMVGLSLQMLTRLRGQPVGDFQDLRLWRRLTIRGIRVARMISPNVVVPMSFSNATYLSEVVGGVTRFEPRVTHVCLVAPLAVIEERLGLRGADRARNAWEYRRAAECCAVHGDPAFAYQIDAANDTPETLAEKIVALVQAEVRRAA